MRRSSRKTVSFALFILLGFLLMAELLLQMLTLSSRTVSAAIAVDPVRGFVPDRVLSWRGNPEFLEHDEHGFRNAGVPSNPRIVTLGDSQTYGSNVGREEAWPHWLDTLGLGPTYNMAFPGWGPLQSYLVMDEALALRPRLIVQAIYLGNDLVDSYTFVYQRGRLAQFKSTDEDVRAALGAASDSDPWDDNPLANQSPLDRDDGPDDEASSRTPVEWLRDHSKLYGFWRALGRAVDYQQRHPYRAESEEDHDPLRDDDYFRFRGAQFSTVLTPTYRLPAVQLDDPRVAEGLRITVEAVGEMHADSAAAGTDFIVLLIPTKELGLADTVATELGRLPTDVAFQTSAEERARDALRDGLSAKGVPLIDALPSLQELAASGILPYSETRDGHLNLAGHETVARVVRDAVDRGVTGTR